MAVDDFNDAQPLRIVGGRPSVHGENPHIVMLSYKVGCHSYALTCPTVIL